MDFYIFSYILRRGNALHENNQNAASLWQCRRLASIQCEVVDNLFDINGKSNRKEFFICNCLPFFLLIETSSVWFDVFSRILFSLSVIHVSRWRWLVTWIYFFFIVDIQEFISKNSLIYCLLCWMFSLHHWRISTMHFHCICMAHCLRIWSR